MYDLLSDERAFWLGSVVVLLVGTAIIVAGAALTCRALRSAIWQRTVWQIGVLGLLALAAVELTGMGTALAKLSRAKESKRVSTVGRGDLGQPELTPGESDAEVYAPAWAFSDRIPVVYRSFDESVEGPVAGWDDLGALGDSVDGESLAGMSNEYAWSAGADDSASGTVGGSEELETAVVTGEVNRTPARWPVAVWASVALVFLGRVFWGRVRLVWFRRHCRKMADTRLRRRVDRLAGGLGLRRPVGVLEAAGLATPVACGLVRPAILLPPGFAGRFDGTQQEVILAHELAHLAGRDPMWQLLADVLCAVLWWNPLTYYLRGGLRTTSEAAADEASLLVPDGPDVLATCLVLLGRQLAKPRRLGWLSMGGSGFRSCLGKRVERLLKLSPHAWRPPRRRLVAGARVAGPLLLVFVIVFCTVWARSQASLTEGESTMNVLTTSWRRSLAATAVMTCLVPLVGGGGEATAGSFAEDAEHRERVERRERAERERAEDRERGEARERREEGERRERGERERRERDEHVQPLVRERAELLERAGAIEREIHGLRDGQDEEARKLRRELEEIHERIGQLNRELGEGRRDRPERPDVFRELIEIAGRATELEVALALLPDDEDERAEKIRKQLEEMEERAKQINREHPEPPAEVMREILHLRRDQLRHAAKRLREAGKLEMAERMEREARESAEKLESLSREHPDRPHPEGPEEMERRHAHVRAAMENLHAAGLHELAERLMGEIEGMHRERPTVPPRDAEPRREGPPRRGNMEPAVEELRGQMAEMRREMDELRGMLKEVLERR